MPSLNETPYTSSYSVCGPQYLPQALGTVTEALRGVSERKSHHILSDDLQPSDHNAQTGRDHVVLVQTEGATSRTAFEASHSIPDELLLSGERGVRSRGARADAGSAEPWTESKSTAVMSSSTRGGTEGGVLTRDDGVLARGSSVVVMADAAVSGSISIAACSTSSQGGMPRLLPSRS